MELSKKLPKELLDELNQISKKQVEEYGKELPPINSGSAEGKIFVPDDLRPLQVLISQKSLCLCKQLIGSCVMCSTNNCPFRAKEDLDFFEEEEGKIEFLQDLFLSELMEKLSISAEDLPHILIGKDFEVFKFANLKESKLMIRIIII